MKKSVYKTSEQEVILVISTTNGPNITNQKALVHSSFLQVYYIAIYLVLGGILSGKRRFSAIVQSPLYIHFAQEVSAMSCTARCHCCLVEKFAQNITNKFILLVLHKNNFGCLTVLRRILYSKTYNSSLYMSRLQFVTLYHH